MGGGCNSATSQTRRPLTAIKLNDLLTVSPSEYNELLTGIIESFSDEFKKDLISKYNQEAHKSEGISLMQLELLAERKEDKLFSAIIKRMVAVKTILNAERYNQNYDIDKVMKLVLDSLFQLNEGALISSIGSQGFLSIPLFRLDKDEVSFQFLRLHIWDSALTDFIDFEKVKDFSIHSHQFHATSWIVAGEVNNTRVDVRETEEETSFSLFRIDWNNSGNCVNQKTSVAVNTERFVATKINLMERYRKGEQYEIKAGEYHISSINTDYPINATLFLFSTDKSRVPLSNVVGPSSVKLSEINRKVVIDPKPFLKKLAQTLK